MVPILISKDVLEPSYNDIAAAAKSLQLCPTAWPHRRQSTRLLCPWDFPGKNTGVGCHFLLHVIILLPCLFNFFAEYIIWNAGPGEAQAGIKIAGRNINNLRYADDTTLMAGSKEELKSLLMKVRGWDGWMVLPTQWTWVWASLGVSDGQGSLACCNPWSHKESDTTDQLNCTDNDKIHSMKPKLHLYQPNINYDPNLLWNIKYAILKKSKYNLLI